MIGNAKVQNCKSLICTFALLHKIESGVEGELLSPNGIATLMVGEGISQITGVGGREHAIVLLYYTMVRYF